MLHRKHIATLRQGFTLVELLVVIAITTLLFALLLRPLIEALRLTQRAQILAAAQDSARKTLEQVAREAGSAVFVFDNASHPFNLTSGTFMAGDDKFTNFLNLQVPKQGGGTAIAHAYNAKLDLVPARRVGEGTGTATDPTTGGNEPINFTAPTSGGSANLSSNGALFPLAPGSTIVRYFIGLKRPVVNGAAGVYANSNERLNTGARGDNTYILYRAQVQPYTYAGGSRTPNSQYFAVAADGKTAELDDPDFFRFVTANDIDWLSPNHAVYGASYTAHNDRVNQWTQVAKPVITAPAIDLLILPHNADGTVAFDTATDPFPGVAHQGVSTDPVPTTPVQYPTVKTSVTFAPATLTADAAPASATAYSEQGVPADAADNGGLPYVPTVYTSADKSWGYPYNLSLYQYADSTTSPFQLRYRTDLGQGLLQYTDMIEYLYVSPTSQVAVYDVTAGAPLAAALAAGSNPGQYVPLIVNPDTGTMSFAVPALPDPNNKFTRFWTVSTATVNATSTTATPGLLDLTDNAQFPNTPLPKDGTAPVNKQVVNAHIVPGSVRVYGPDATPGPNLGNSVLYSAASPGALLTFNQYRLDYLNSTLTFYVNGTEQLPVNKSEGPPPVPADPVTIAYDYQANLAPLDTTRPISDVPDTTVNPARPANPARAMQVKVDYQTRDLLDINVGVRVYDPSSGRPLTVPQSTRVQIGNPNR